MHIDLALIAILLTATAAPGDAGEDAFPLPPGYRWEMAPAEIPESWTERGWDRMVDSGALALLQNAAGEVHVTHTRIGGEDTAGVRAPKYEVHLIDASGVRLRHEMWSMAAGSAARVERYRFTIDGDEQPPAQLGLAILDDAGRRIVARAAASAAETVGASALPYPAMGEPFGFSLQTMDGDTIDATDLRGRVILIDCWATWCGPCMKKMPRLRELHDRYRDEGLVVIGVNFDETETPARTTIADRDLDWPHVHAATTARGYDGDLWADLTTITAIPRLFLVDRRGVLRNDFYPHDMESRVRALLAETPESE